jgi:iron(III) transport system permease protein
LIKRLQSLDLFQIISILFLSLLGVLLLQFFPALFTPASSAWMTVQNYLLTPMIINSIILAGGSGLLAGVIGVGAAYMVTLYDFPFRKILTWLLVLPLAMPSYVLAYVYTSMTSFQGTLDQFIRFFIPLSQPLSIANMGGAIVLFGTTLYPYVYLASRSFLLRQPASLLDSARLLGKGETAIFWHVFLPLLKPALIGSVVLVMMEVLNDYGLTSYFGMNVFATGIFRLWFNGNDVESAIRLSLIILFVVLIILWIESGLRKHKPYGYATTRIKAIQRIQLPNWVKAITVIFMLVVLSIGFFIPLLQFMLWFPFVTTVAWDAFFSLALWNTVALSTGVALLIALIAFALNQTLRQPKSFLRQGLKRFATLGYSVPGSIIALAVVMLFAPIDRWLFVQFDLNFLVLTSFFVLLVIALVIRYFAVSFNFTESGFQKIGMKFTQASYTLGKSKMATAFLIDLPMIQQGLIAGTLIVMVDLFKELPLTLFLRPLGFDTLATRIFQFASDEQVLQSTPLALLLIGITSIFVLFANRFMIKGKIDESIH